MYFDFFIPKIGSEVLLQQLIVMSKGKEITMHNFFWDALYVIWHLELLGGHQLKKDTLYNADLLPLSW